MISDQEAWSNETLLATETFKYLEGLRISRKVPIKLRDGIEKEETMVGLKTVWISLCALFLVAACVPQTKQTDCRSNEAFNAQLRTCVPVVASVDSFINFTSFIPTSSLSRYKNDTTPMSFKVYVANPYSESYTLRWKVSFNGVDTALSNSFDPTQQDILPISYNGEIGLHILTVEAVNASSVVVADHHFEFVISNLPRPYIDTASVLPSVYTPVYTPNSATATFQFSIKNNNSDIPLPSTYQTQWKLYKNGVDTTLQVPNVANQDFSDITATGVHTSSVTFNPNILTGFGVGSYILRARIISTALTEVVDERQWSITVQHAPLSPILTRDLIKNSVLAYGTTVVAYHGVDYLSATTYNFRPAGQAQANFCVKITDGDGAYNGDLQFVKVSYFLDGAGSPVYEGYTTDILNSEICLSDVANTNQAAIVLSNSSATSEQDHTIVARVYDVATGQEYTTSNMSSGTGTYPLVWNLRVKPQNKAPTVAYGTVATGLTGCSASTATPRTGCTSKSDNNFAVSINLTGDDFYFSPYDETKFDYSIKLIQDGTIIQECTKTDPDVLGATDVDGTNGYQCVFNIPSYTAVGPFNVTLPQYRIQASITDTGSPIAPTTPVQSDILTWNLVITEENTAPTVSAFTAAPVIEGANITFNVTVSDPQRDSFDYVIQYCKDDAVADAACTNKTDIAAGTYTKTDNLLASSFTVSALITEDFLLNLPLIPCNTIARGALCGVRFRAVATDKPFVAAPIIFTYAPAVSVNITNTNPAPVFTPTLATPNSSTFAGSAFVGNPFTVSTGAAGVITDASSITTVEGKNFHRYQWYAKNNTSVTTYQPIDSATGFNLIWTPSLITNLGADSPVQLMVCVEDQPANIVPTPIAVLSVCNDGTGGRLPWTVIIRNNVVTIHDLSAAPTSTELAINPADTGKEMAVWYEPPTTFNGVSSSAVYTAMFDNNMNIQVKRTLVQNDGQIVPSSATIIASFAALEAPTVVTAVKDLSMTGIKSLVAAGPPVISDNSLYIAYMASNNTSPLNYYPQVRRIDFSTGKVAPAISGNLFGFDYDGVDIVNNCATAGECVVTNLANGTNPTIQFVPAADITGNITINVGGYTQAIAFAPPPIVVGQICSTCTAGTMALNLANAINANTDQLLGVTATVVGDTVTLRGSLADDAVDLSTTLVSRIAGQMGSIYVTATNWYVPFITKNGGTVNVDRMSVISGAVNVNMQNGTAITLFEPNSNATLALLPQLSSFSTYFDGTDLIVAGVKVSGSSGVLYRLKADDFTNLATPATIMTGKVLYDVKVASAPGGNSYVNATYENSGNNIMFGVYAADLSTTREFAITDSIYVDTTTQDYFNISDMSSYKIIPYGTEARVIAASKGTGTNYHLYIARLYNNGSSWALTCRECEKVSGQVEYVGPYVGLGVAPIRTKVAADPLYRLSSDGSVTSQGIKDVLFMSFATIDDPITPTTSNPTLGVYNMEPEQISALDLYVGPALSENAGLYRPPFLKN